MKKICLLLILNATFGILNCKAQTITSSNNKWIINNPFEFKVFVENKGQYNSSEIGAGLKNNLVEDSILFAAAHNGVNIYFTLSGVTYRHVEVEQLLAEEREEREEREEIEEEIPKNEDPEMTNLFLNIEWMGVNPNASIIGIDKVNNYFTYPDIYSKSGTSTLRARAFSKIIYKNIYPNIDLEYTFPEGKEGIKYSLILNPGSNTEDIRIRYKGAKKISLDAKGNLIIESDFGEFIDHAPVVFYEDGEKINSSFDLKDNIVSFKINKSLSEKRTIIIDPWLTIPSFTGTTSAYDIDWDYNGNIYIQGGQTPYQLMKLNSSGTIQWTFTNIFTGSGSSFYGDFCVDRNTGTSFLCEGKPSANNARIVKVNTQGVQTGLYPGDFRIAEMWHIAYNSCTNKGVVGCGNILGDLYFNAATFDTSLTTITPINAFTGSADIAFMAIDDTNAYFVSSKGEDHSGTNTLIKCPVSTLTPASYAVNTGYDFAELNSITFSYFTNSYNGMAKSRNYLYTYDGKVIKKWNPANGNLLNSVIANSVSFSCGGIAVDDCDNVFVGTQSGVSKYDSNLNFIVSSPTPGKVYDVDIGPIDMGAGAEILACGVGFAAVMDLRSFCSASPSFSLSPSSTPTSCAGNDGTATVIPLTGTPPYNYLWMHNGETSSTITGLTPGVYTVAVFDSTDAGCYGKEVATTTVTVLAGAGFPSQTLNATKVTCYGGNNGTATSVVTGGLEPYSYIWSPGGQTTANATALTEGIYTSRITDANGCQTIDSISVDHLSDSISLIANSHDIGCDYSPGSITLQFPSGSDYTFLWSTGATTSSVYYLTEPGDYSVLVTDTNGCNKTLNFTITQPLNPPWYTSSVIVTDASCNTNNGNIVIHFTGDSLFDLSFTWYDSDWNLVTGDSVLTGLWADTYRCNISDNLGCKDTTFNITLSNLSPAIICNATSISPVCGNINNGSATVGVFNGTPPYTYLWSSGETTQTAAGLGAGTSTVTVTDAMGCTRTDNVTLQEIQSDTIIIVQQGDSLIVLGASYDSYQWYLNNSPVLNATNTIYIAQQDGNYYVVGSNDSCAFQSNTIQIGDIGLNENSNFETVSVYPNPAARIVNVEINLVNPANAWVKFYDALGQALWLHEFKNKTQSLSVQIPVSDYTAGIYFIEIKTESESRYIKIEVQK